MPRFSVDAGFSLSPIALKVDQKFGLAGVARLYKLLELLASSPSRDTGLIELSPSDWQEALQMGAVLLTPFLNYLQQAEWLSVEQAVEPGSTLRVTVLAHSSFMQPSAELDLFTKADQWRIWCAHELGLPPSVGTDPYVQQLFRRWCASNVTVTEMQAAIVVAIDKQNSLSPQILNAVLADMRKQRLAQAVA